MRYVIRLITLPFVLCLVVVACLRWIALDIICYMRYGGEFITYREPRKTIADVFIELKRQQAPPPNI